MAHARRKIHDVHVRTPAGITTEALRRIGELYAIEAEIRGSPADERLSVRKARSVLLMQSLYDWVQVQMTVLSRHSDTAKAFAYLLKQWDALNLYCGNGWTDIDNNIAENALRTVALGRKTGYLPVQTAAASGLQCCTPLSAPTGLTAWTRKYGCVMSSVISRTGRSTDCATSCSGKPISHRLKRQQGLDVKLTEV